MGKKAGTLMMGGIAYITTLHTTELLSKKVPLPKKFALEPPFGEKNTLCFFSPWPGAGKKVFHSLLKLAGVDIIKTLWCKSEKCNFTPFLSNGKLLKT